MKSLGLYITDSNKINYYKRHIFQYLMPFPTEKNKQTSTHTKTTPPSFICGTQKNLLKNRFKSIKLELDSNSKFEVILR